MSTVVDQSAFDRGAEPLFRLLTTEQWEQLVALPPDHDLEARVEQLSELSREGDLADKERAEFEGYVRANNLLAILQGIARRRLATRNDAS